MLGQAHTPRRRSLPFAFVLVVVLAVPALGLAGSTPSASNLRAQNTALAAKSRSAVLGLYALDSQLGQAQSRLDSLSREASALRAQRASVALQLRVARRGSLIAQRALADRLRTLYEQGNVEPLEVVLGSKSLDEAISGLDNLSRASGEGELVLHEVESARRSLEQATARLRHRASALAADTEAAHATEAQLAQARAARSSYLASLSTQRQLNTRAIARLVVAAHAAQVRSARIAASAAVAAPLPVPAATPEAAPATTLDAATSPPPAAAPGTGRTITVTATGYALDGTTATGLPVGWGIVAVDPSVIPLGTHMTIPGYGEAVAADTGGAIVGATIDLWFPTVAQANAWGRQTVTISLH